MGRPNLLIALADRKAIIALGRKRNLILVLSVMKRFLLLVALYAILPFANLVDRLHAQEKAEELADLILHHAKVLTVDEKFTIAEAVAVKGERILAVGSDEAVLKLKGPKTKVIDAQGRNVLPGLYDSHTHPTGAATSEAREPLPRLKTLD